MYLKRSFTINWGNLPTQELEYGEVNLFSGGNGSGKTTAADALQTLMTAAHTTLFNYNPGQDETTQRSRRGKQVRTLASYILGCDDGAYSRPWDSDGYIVGVFHPTKGESAEPFTAVIGVRAYLDKAGSTAQAKESELLLMIVPDEMLGRSDFLRQDPKGEASIVPITDIADKLRQQFGKKKVETYEKKGQYLARLYGALRGKHDAVSQQEAKNAAKTFARFMAYKPVDSIDEFVANEVLEPHDMSDTIRKIRNIMRSVHSMAEEAEQLQRDVELLEEARTHANHYVENWLEKTTQSYGAAAQRYTRNRKLYLSKKEEQEKLRQQQQNNLDESQQVSQRQSFAHKELVALEARIQGIPALRDKQQLEENRKLFTEQLHEGARPLIEEDNKRSTNFEALKNINDILKRHSIELELPALASKLWRNTSKDLLGRDSHHLPDFTQMMSKAWIDLSPLEQGLDKIRSEQELHNRLAALLYDAREENPGQESDSVSQTLDRIVNRRSQALEEIEKQEKRVQQNIKTLESKKINYPSYVAEALKAIRFQCPKADPRVLCDHVDVKDPEWQMAIEGYIGGNRFSILVEADYESEAIRIVRQLAGKQRSKAKVIQGEKARHDAEKLELPEDSIFHILNITHGVARSYLKASYGSVIRVADADELRRTRRGITQNGMASGNYVLFRCDVDDNELVFGEHARERNLRAQRENLQTLKEDYRKASEQYQAVKQLQTQVRLFKPLQWVSVATHLVETQRNLRGTEESLANLDLSDHAALEQKQREANEEYARLEERKGRLKEESGKIEEKINTCGKEIGTLADKSEEYQRQKEEAENFIKDCTKYYSDLNVEQLIDDMDNRLANAQGEIDFEAEEKALTDLLHKHVRAFDKAVDDYNQQAKPADRLHAEPPDSLHSAKFFGFIHNLSLQVDSLHNRLRNEVLLDKVENLSSLRETFNTTFVSDLCNEIHQSIKGGEHVLKNLNGELEHHRFGADREWFSFEWKWIPEFKEYWDFFKEIMEIPNLGDGTSLFDSIGTTLSEKAITVRDRLLNLLLDGDEQQALRELDRISDYRRYRQYDILKHPEGKNPISLSRYGTGSGGQLETPAYIIRAAAVTSAFRFNDGNASLKMVIVDEAFMHMDESRSKSVIDYLTNTLGLQLIFIMPTSKAGPFMDLIDNQFVFSKVPSPTPIGELNTRVLVDRQQFEREAVGELWEQKRREIKQQSALDFMEDI